MAALRGARAWAWGALALSIMAVPVAATAQNAGTGTGTVTGLPIPRFVSLRPSDTPLREGPSTEHRIKWVFKREGLPVEIIAEHDNWRRVRDADGDDGWVFHSRLSGRRTVQVARRAGVSALPIHAEASADSPVTAQLQPGVIADLRRCDGRWCLISGEGFRGFMQQDRLWGVYPGETVR